MAARLEREGTVALAGLDPVVRRPPPLPLDGLGFLDVIFLSSVGATRNLTTSVVLVFLMIVAGALVDIFNRRDRAERGRLSSSTPFAPLAAPSILWLSPVFLRRLRRPTTCSSASAEDVLRFLSTRDPSMGSSSRTSWLNTECESGFTAPRCDGRRSLASLGAVARLAAGGESASTMPFNSSFNSS